MVAPKAKGHSARVRLEVHAGGHRFPVGQIGGGRLVFDTPVVLPGTTGEVIAWIDDEQERWSVTWEQTDTPKRIISAEFRHIP